MLIKAQYSHCKTYNLPIFYKTQSKFLSLAQLVPIVPLALFPPFPFM